MAQELVGSLSWPIFIFETLIGFGWIAYMAASALARGWRPWWQNLLYGVILGVANRLLEMMLFKGDLASPIGYCVDTLYITAVLLLSYRVVLTRKMVAQYPWQCERAGVFGWRDKPLAE